MPDARTKLYSRLPTSPGVYIFKNARGKVLYVGKAVNLRRRVSSYFLRAHDRRMEKLVSEIRKVAHEKTPSALEALILESSLIKKFNPPYNIREKDDKSFLYIEITREKYPRVLLVRGKSKAEGERHGPFVSAGSAREALRILRKIFPWNAHPPEKVGKIRSCFDYEIGLCPGTCFGKISRAGYLKNIRNLTLFLTGKRREVVKNLEREMKSAAKSLQFEKAGKIRGQLFSLKHIQDTALIGNDEFRNSNFEFQTPENDKPNVIRNSKFRIRNSRTGIADTNFIRNASFRIRNSRIEGYDISNISGTDAVGVMVVFENGEPKKSDYRKFLIKTVMGSNDVGMLREVMRRRFGNAHPGPGWEFPDLVLVDGGKPQVNAARDELKKLKVALPVVGIAKGPARKRTDVHGEIPEWAPLQTLVRLRDESHRFAIAFHRKRRSVRMKN